MLIESTAVTKESDLVSMDQGDDSMYVGEGESILTRYVSSSANETVEQDSALLLYGRNIRLSNDERTHPPEITYQNSGVRFQSPGWKGSTNTQGVQKMREEA